MKLSHIGMAALGLTLFLFAALLVMSPADRNSRLSKGDDKGFPEWPALDVYWQILDRDPSIARSGLDRVISAWRPGSAIMLLDILRWQENRPFGSAIKQVIVEKLGLKSFSWDEARLAIWANAGDLHPEFAEFKSRILSLIDPRIGDYFYRNVPATIRLDQIQWGGVLRDGIPPLREPLMISASDAGYLHESDVVFGVEINGDVRAYPKRILAWHEMFRDSIGGVPVAGVYCTLCGTTIVYERTFAGVTHDLGTSGLLYQSSKLMYDAATSSLWSTLTGQPVVGALVGKGIALQRRPVVTTTWGAWRKLHPDSAVLSLDTGFPRDYGEGVAYASYFSSDELMFPVPKRDDRLPDKDEVVGLRSDDGRLALAISAEFLKQHPVYHDKLGNDSLVVLTDSSGANRVFECASLQFESWDGGPTIRDRNGSEWAVSETGLRNGQRVLSRIPAHRSFWFGWFAAFPDTRLVK
jgi:hypothetical protein